MGEYFGLHLPGALTGYDGEDDTERLKNALADMQLYESSTYRDRGEFHIYSPYVRWDAFVAFLNNFVLLHTTTPPSPTPIIFSDLIEEIFISPNVPTFLLLIFAPK